MLPAYADTHRDGEPFTAFDGVRRNDLRRVLRILARMELAKFRRELLRLLTGSVHSRNAQSEAKEKHGGNGAR